MKHPIVLDMLAGLMHYADNDGRPEGEPGTHSNNYLDEVFALYQQAGSSLMNESNPNEDQWKFLEFVVIPKLKQLENEITYYKSEGE